MPESESALPPSRGPSLIAQTASWLRRAIDAGAWSELLPGERELSARLGVSRPTLRQALKQLQREGVIHTSERKRWRIRRQAKRRQLPGDSRGSIGVLCARDPREFPSFQRTLVDAARQRLERNGFRVETLARPTCYSQRPGRALERLVNENSVDAWMLFHAPPRAHRWFAKNRIPCVVSGSCEPGVELPSVDLDHGAVSSHALGALVRAGCRRPALVSPKGDQPGDVDGEKKFLEAARQLLKPPSAATVIHHDETVPGLLVTLERIWRRRNPPDGILFARARYALASMTWLLGRGVRIPGDVALIVRHDDVMLEYATPRIACYRANPALFGHKLAAELASVAGSGFGSNRRIRLLPEFSKEETA